MLSALAFALFAGVCMVLAFARHPVFGLYFYLGTMYVHPPSRWWGYLLPDLRWALLSAAVTIAAVAWHRGRLAPRPLWLANAPAVLLAMYVGWMWVQLPWALDTQDHLNGSIQVVKYLVAFWFVYRITDTKEMLSKLLFAHVLGCALLGVYAMFTGREGGRLDGVGGPGIDDSNTLAMYLATGAIACMALAMLHQGWRRWLAFGALALIGQGFVLANSRGAFLGLVAGGLVLMICKAREHRRMFWGFALVGLLGFVAIVDTAFIERMFTIGDVAEKDNEDADMSARSRMVIIEAQLRMAADYPHGVGHRGTAVLSSQYMDRRWLTLERGSSDESTAGRSSHNTFMTTLVEQGLPGVLIYLALLLWLLSAIVTVRRLNRQGMDPQLATLGGALCGGLVVVHVAGLATDYLLAEVQYWLYAGLVSMLQLGAASVQGSMARAGAQQLHALEPARS